MNILALEMATDACSVALLSAGDIYSRHQIAPRQHTDLVLGMIDGVLVESGLKRRDIDALAFGQGPGSFTGVRIAASIVQGIALARALPVLPVSTLRALAAGAVRLGSGSDVLVALDARRDEIYFAAYAFDACGNVSETLVSDTVMAAEDVEISIDRPWLTAGNGWDAYRARFSPRLRALPDAVIVLPDARDVARLGALDLAAGCGLGAHDALPRYLRGAVD